MFQRKEERFSKQLYVIIRLESKMVHGIVNDFSENGLFVRCNQDFTVGAVVGIEIFMPDNNNAEVKGIVRSRKDTPESHRKYGFGIELTEKDIVYRRFLKTFKMQTAQPPQAPSKAPDRQAAYSLK